MARVREAAERYIREAREALETAKRIVEGHSDEEILGSSELRYALRYSIILLVEAVFDLALLILEKVHGVEPRSYREAAALLASKGVISSEALADLEKLAALRNIVVHRYWVVDDLRLAREARGSGLAAIERVLNEVAGFLESLEEGGGGKAA